MTHKSMNSQAQVEAEAGIVPVSVPIPNEPNDAKGGLAAVLAQEKSQAKPTLHASPQLGAWLCAK